MMSQIQIKRQEFERKSTANTMATAALPASVSKGLVALAALDSAAFSAVRAPFTWRDVISHLLDACSAQTRYFSLTFSLRSSLCTVADHSLCPQPVMWLSSSSAV
jgi:hypothetical protein